MVKLHEHQATVPSQRGAAGQHQGRDEGHHETPAVPRHFQRKQGHQEVTPGQQPQVGGPPSQQQMMHMQQQQMAAQQQALQLPNINVAELDQLQGDDRNNFVGNNIYMPIMQAFGEEYAPTITGMLLDESAVDFKLLLT